jgi:transposase
MEIITGVERRRRWRAEEKLRIVAEAEAPGACFAEVARRYEVSRGLLWYWRRQARNGALVSAEDGCLVPVHVIPEEPPTPAASERRWRRQRSVSQDATIEIALPDGTTIKVGRDVGTAALRRVLGALGR